MVVELQALIRSVLDRHREDVSAIAVEAVADAIDIWTCAQRTVWEQRADGTVQMTPNWLTPKQVGRVLGAHRKGGEPTTTSYVRLLAAEGKLTSYRTPYGRLYHADDVMDFLERRGKKA